MAKTRTIAARAAVLAAAGLLGGGLAACSGSMKVETSSTPAVSAADLQKDLTDTSVTCKDDLVGEVGKSAACDVELGENSSEEAVFTATKVDGTAVTYDITPALSKDQLQKVVSGTASGQQAACDSGLAGKAGAKANCEVIQDGAPSKRVAIVNGIGIPAPLSMDVSVVQVLPKQRVQEMMMQQMGADGNPVESIDCVDDVLSKKGSVVECTASAGGKTQALVVTVTNAQGSDVTLSYEAKP